MYGSSAPLLSYPSCTFSLSLSLAHHPLPLAPQFWFNNLVMTMPFPVGLYIPTMAVGAGFGRLFGEVVYVLGLRPEPLSALFSVVGAASMAAGVTHTYSTAIVMVEITGQLTVLLPILVGLSTAMLVSKKFSVSVYDGIAEKRGLPFLPNVPKTQYNLRARDVMDGKDGGAVAVCARDSYANIIAALDRRPDWKFFPVVSDRCTHTIPFHTIQAHVTRWCSSHLCLATPQSPSVSWVAWREPICSCSCSCSARAAWASRMARTRIPAATTTVRFVALRRFVQLAQRMLRDCATSIV